jgi:hypothetical protein
MLAQHSAQQAHGRIMIPRSRTQLTCGFRIAVWLGRQVQVHPLLQSVTVPRYCESVQGAEVATEHNWALGGAGQNWAHVDSESSGTAVAVGANGTRNDSSVTYSLDHGGVGWRTVGW